MKLALFFATIGCLYSIMIARESGEPLIGVCVGIIIFVTGMYIYLSTRNKKKDDDNE